MPTTPVHDLSLLSDGHAVARLLQGHFHGAVRAVERIGEGFYAHVYRAELERDPGVVAVKCHLLPGYSAREAAQLEVLRRHARARVPGVLAVHARSVDFPAEALTMEWIPGVNASKLEFTDEGQRRRFADAVVENLLGWHTVEHAAGFGDLEGPFASSWAAVYGQRVARWHAALQTPQHEAVVSAAVRHVLDRSREALGTVFAGRGQRAVLVHSDYNAWNMLADPQTCALTGVIDPVDAGWADLEIDLFHLPNARPDFGLIDRYLEEIEVDDQLWLRLRFYRLWDDVKHYLRLGWYREDYFRLQADLLAAQLERLS